MDFHFFCFTIYFSDWVFKSLIHVSFLPNLLIDRNYWKVVFRFVVIYFWWIISRHNSGIRAPAACFLAILLSPIFCDCWVALLSLSLLLSFDVLRWPFDLSTYCWTTVRTISFESGKWFFSLILYLLESIFLFFIFLIVCFQTTFTFSKTITWS